MKFNPRGLIGAVDITARVIGLSREEFEKLSEFDQIRIVTGLARKMSQKRPDVFGGKKIWALENAILASILGIDMGEGKNTVTFVITSDL